MVMKFHSSIIAQSTSLSNKVISFRTTYSIDEVVGANGKLLVELKPTFS